MLSMRKFRKLMSMRAEIEWNEKLLIDLEWPYSLHTGYCKVILITPEIVER